MLCCDNKPTKRFSVIKTTKVYFMLTLHVDHPLEIIVIIQDSRDQGPSFQILQVTKMGVREPQKVLSQQLSALVKSDKTHWSEIVTWTPTPTIKRARKYTPTAYPKGRSEKIC